MKTRWIIVCLCSLAACRGIIGVEELTLTDGGSETDGGSGDASPDRGAPPPDANADGGLPATCAAEGPECFRCCKDALQGENHQMEIALVAEGCICNGDGGACSEACAATACVSKPPGQDSCPPCLDTHFSDDTPACNRARASCTTSGKCANVVACLMACR